tara:strand:- start:212 stop:1348 length:1137 start_codon:yes stop_codon:yes gene_type:complete
MYTPFKMKGKSPMMKKLIGNQHRLPAELKAKIEAAPESPSKMKKSAAKMKKASMTKMKKESMAKLKKSAAKMKKGKVNPFSAEYKRMNNKQRERKYGADYKDRIQGSGKKTITRENIGEALNTTRGKINKLNENIQQGAETLSKNLKKTKQIKIADKLKLPKKGEGTPPKGNDNEGNGKIPWKTAPAVGTTARTKWYKKYNLKLDDTTPALMKKSAAKMKKAPAKMKKESMAKMKKSVAKLKKKTKLLKGVKRGALRNAKTSEEAMTKVSLNALQMAVEGGAKNKKTKKGLVGKQTGVKKSKLKSTQQKGLTARELRIKRNREFLPIAIKKGLAPKRPSYDLSAKGRAELKAYEKFYSNKDNVKKLKKAQEQYFKNKK